MTHLSAGAHIFASGNRCAVTLEILKPRTIAIRRKWEKEPSADDREKWSFDILGKRAMALREYATQQRAVIGVIREMVRDGKIKRDGVWRPRTDSFAASRRSQGQPSPLPRPPIMEPDADVGGVDAGIVGCAIRPPVLTD